MNENSLLLILLGALSFFVGVFFRGLMNPPTAQALLKKSIKQSKQQHDEYTKELDRLTQEIKDADISYNTAKRNAVDSSSRDQSL